MLFQDLLAPHYSPTQLKAFFATLPTAPHLTTLRVNTLKYTAQQAKYLLEEHFKSRNEPFEVQISADFDDILLVPGMISTVPIEPSVKEIVVDVECAAALLRGADLFTVGILGMDESIEEGDLVSVWVDVEGKCLKGSKRAAFSGLSKRFIGNGHCELSRRQVFGDSSGLNAKSSSSGVAVRMTQMPMLQPSLNGILPDVLFLQNLPSMLTAHALNPLPGSRVLDMCAAPGGKTTHLAQLMRNRGSLMAVDKNAKKIGKIEENCRRFGIEIVSCRKGDARKLVEGDARKLTEEDARRLIASEQSFDYILLDPPCSGLGQRPSFLDANSPLKDLPSFPEHQRELFQAAVKLLKPGGCLVYSTCTVNPAENEQQVAWALRTFPSLQLIPIREAGGAFERLSQPGLMVDGLTAEQCSSSVCRFWPGDHASNDTIGFFLCKFRKQQE